MSDEESYRLYLERFASLFGSIDEGDYGKRGDQVVKKLSPTDFARAWRDFIELRATSEGALARGYTSTARFTKSFANAPCS